MLGQLNKLDMMEDKRDNGDLMVLWLEKMLDSGQTLLSVLREVPLKPHDELPNIDKNSTTLADGNQMFTLAESRDSLQEHKIEVDCKKEFLDLGAVFVSNGTKLETEVSLNSEPELNLIEKMLISTDWESMVENVIHGENKVDITSKNVSLSCIEEIMKANKAIDIEEYSTITKGPRGKLFQCKMCGKTFKKSAFAGNHIMKKHISRVVRYNVLKCLAKRFFECDDCGKKFKGINTLQNHVEHTHRGRPSKCQLCNFSGTIVDVSRHRWDIHKNKEEKECGFCGKQFHSEGGLKHHIESHGNETYDCEACGKEFKVAKTFQRHSLYCAQPKTHICDKCGAKFSLARGLEMHKITHIDKKLLGYTCSICSKQLRMKRSLDEHMTKHSESKPLGCNNCEETFKRRSSLSLHKRRAHEEPKEEGSEPKEETQTAKEVEVGNTPVLWIKEPSLERLVNGKKAKYFYMPEGNFKKGPPYKCLICAFKSKSKSDVRLHFHKVHRKERLFRCIECDARKEKWQQVVTHWNRIHNPNREDQLKFVCETCGKKYQEQSELKIHVLVHGESKYPCKYCGKGFKSPYAQKYHETERHEKEHQPCRMCGKMLSGMSVKVHERVVHFNEEKIDCDFCEKTLKTKRNLQLHMDAVHGTVEKTHHCHVCDAKFRVASRLKNHIETVHEKTRLFPCPFCKTVLNNKNQFKRHSKRLHQGSDLPQEMKEQLVTSRMENFQVKVIADE